MFDSQVLQAFIS